MSEAVVYLALHAAVIVVATAPHGSQVVVDPDLNVGRSPASVTAPPFHYLSPFPLSLFTSLKLSLYLPVDAPGFEGVATKGSRSKMLKGP